MIVVVVLLNSLEAGIFWAWSMFVATVENVIHTQGIAVAKISCQLEICLSVDYTGIVFAVGVLCIASLKACIYKKPVIQWAAIV